MAHQKKKQSGIFVKLILLLITVVMLVGIATYSVIFTKKDVNYTLIIKKGDNVATIAKQLEAAQIISNKDAFKLIVRYTGDETKIAIGIYKINGNLSLYDIAQKVTYGTPDMLAITFLEGWNFKQIRNALNKNALLTHDSESMTDEQIKAALKITYPHVEGLIYPSTYFIAPYQSDLDVLRLANKTMADKLANAWAGRKSGLIYKSPYEMLILASLVQKEVSAKSDMVVVATVFNNRLNKGMKLQDDPAVFYGLDNKDTVTRADFKIDTPYNTYLHSGLTPTPICSVGEDALYAAGHPNADKTLLYFIATKDGRTIYNSNFAEHSKAVDKYLRNK